MRLIERDAHLIKKTLNEYHELERNLENALNVSEGEKELMIIIGIDKEYVQYVAELKEKIEAKERFFTNLLEGYVDIILNKK